VLNDVLLKDIRSLQQVLHSHFPSLPSDKDFKSTLKQGMKDIEKKRQVKAAEKEKTLATTVQNSMKTDGLSLRRALQKYRSAWNRVLLSVCLQDSASLILFLRSLLLSFSPSLLLSFSPSLLLSFSVRAHSLLTSKAI
jgi:hypothetical protein